MKTNLYKKALVTSLKILTHAPNHKLHPLTNKLNNLFQNNQVKINQCLPMLVQVIS